MTNTTPEGLAERAEAGHTRRDGESMNDFAWRAVEESGALCKELVITLRASEEQRDRMRGALERLCAVVAKVETAAFGNRVETEDWMELSFARQDAQALGETK